MVRPQETKETLAVAVSRFGHDAVPVCVEDGATVQQVLEKAGVTLDGREKVFNAGAEVSMRDLVDDGDVLSIVTPKAAGNN